MNQEGLLAAYIGEVWYLPIASKRSSSVRELGDELGHVVILCLGPLLLHLVHKLCDRIQWLGAQLLPLQQLASKAAVRVGPVTALLHESIGLIVG